MMDVMLENGEWRLLGVLRAQLEAATSRHRHTALQATAKILILSVIVVFSLLHCSNEYYCIINSETY